MAPVHNRSSIPSVDAFNPGEGGAGALAHVQHTSSVWCFSGSPTPVSIALAPLPRRAVLPVCAVASLPRRLCRRRLCRLLRRGRCRRFGSSVWIAFLLGNAHLHSRTQPAGMANRPRCRGCCADARVHAAVIVCTLLNLPVCVTVLAGEDAYCRRWAGRMLLGRSAGCREALCTRATARGPAQRRPWRRPRRRWPLHIPQQAAPLPPGAGISGVHAAGARAGAGCAAARVHQPARKFVGVPGRAAHVLRRRTAGGGLAVTGCSDQCIVTQWKAACKQFCMFAGHPNRTLTTQR